MDKNEIKVLLVEDDPADARLIQRTLQQSDRTGFQLTHLTRLGDALQRLNQESFERAVLDREYKR